MRRSCRAETRATLGACRDADRAGHRRGADRRAARVDARRPRRRHRRVRRRRRFWSRICSRRAPSTSSISPSFLASWAASPRRRWSAGAGFDPDADPRREARRPSRESATSSTSATSFPRPRLPGSDRAPRSDCQRVSTIRSARSLSSPSRAASAFFRARCVLVALLRLRAWPKEQKRLFQNTKGATEAYMNDASPPPRGPVSHASPRRRRLRRAAATPSSPTTWGACPPA